ncbi:MAG: DNA polymerase Y family protein [Actinomycetota bacterium]|nr:DNA polymerase Y family protein [Actinomycetota bacterium]
MERTLCVWYPDWALRRPDTPPGEPAQAIGADHKVVAINDAAASFGVTVGMRRRQAEAICPAIRSLTSDPTAEAVGFEPVVAAVEELIPRVEVVQPGMLLAPVTGAVRYYGDEWALVGRVVDAIEAVTGSGHRIGLAAGPFAARCAAELAVGEPLVVEDDRSFLRSLDVTSLDREELAATFRWLGITTLGQVADLPRQAMVSRFGSEGLDAHRLAHGEDRRPQPREVPVDLAVEERFDPPLDNLDQAAFVGRALAHRLLTETGRHGSTPFRVLVEAESASGTTRSRIWRNADPFDESTLGDRIRWQLAAWLDEARLHHGPGIGGGVVRLRLVPADLSDQGRQLALHEDARRAAETHRTLVQIQALVGPDRVLATRPQGGRDPGDRVQWNRWDDRPTAPSRDPMAPWPGAVPAPSPALVPDKPTPFEVEWEGGIPERVRLGSRWEPVLSWAGPWRRMGRWWEGEPPADRYQIVTSAGAFLCEVRDGATYLTGIYD